MAITFERQNSQIRVQQSPTSISSKKSGWIPTTATCSAITQDGIPEVWETITKFIELTKSNDYFNENVGTERILDETINEQLKGNFFTIPKYKIIGSNKKSGAKR
jgi:LAO/AO transport system kinase